MRADWLRSFFTVHRRRIVRLQRHGFAVQEVAVIHPYLLHHDAVAGALAVDHNGGVAAVVITLGYVGWVAGTRLRILQQDVVVQMAVLVVLGQVLDDGVPGFYHVCTMLVVEFVRVIRAI